MRSKCEMNHQPLQIIARDGTEYEVVGGNASRLMQVKDLDLVVDLTGMADIPGFRQPWAGPQTYIVFPIRDMRAPDSKDDFVAMVRWLAELLSQGYRIGVGCMGGHGRTGMVLSYLYYLFTDDPGAIARVRELYCQRAVETDTQIRFLRDLGLSGVKPVRQSGSWFDSFPGKIASIQPAQSELPWEDEEDLVFYPDEEVTPLHDVLDRLLVDSKDQ